MCYGGTDVAKSSGGQAPLGLAARRNYTDIVDELVEPGGHTEVGYVDGSLRLAVKIPDTAEAIGHPHGPPSRPARRTQVTAVEVTLGGARSDGPGSNAWIGRGAARHREEDVFRRIVGFL
eukprot:g8761.t1